MHRGTRKEETLRSEREQMIDQWLERNRGRMVQCHCHPGDLMITREGCSARRQRAEQEDFFGPLTGYDEHDIYRLGLAICLACGGRGRKSESR